MYREIKRDRISYFTELELGDDRERIKKDRISLADILQNLS